MTKNHTLARAILDSGWITFGQMLKYKTKIIDVHAANTSVQCSRCGTNVPKSLAVRIHRCSNCKMVLDRDYNAAKNILQRGLKGLLAECEEVKPVESESSLNQEAYGLIQR
jgi:putative transposase